MPGIIFIIKSEKIFPIKSLKGFFFHFLLKINENLKIYLCLS